MKLKSIACLLASVALCVSLVGCGGQSQDQTGSQQVETVSIDATPIQVERSGFSVSNDGEVNYVFTMNNPNDGYIADRVTFSISGYDEDGNMVLGAAESVERMFPGIQYAVAGTSFMAGSGTLSRIEITPSMDGIGWIETDIDPDSVSGLFSIVNPRTARLADDSASISGRVVADEEETIANIEGVSADAISAKICAVLLDSEGNLVGGAMADGLVFDQEEGVVHETEGTSGNGEAEEQAEDASSEGEVLKAAQFSITIQGAPGFKECRYFVMPV